MSKELVSQKMKMVCEGCGVVKEYELVDAKAETIMDMQNWYTIGRHVYANGQLIAIATHACSVACVPVATVKLALPPIQEEEPLSNIDLAALQVGSKKTELVN